MTSNIFSFTQILYGILYFAYGTMFGFLLGSHLAYKKINKELDVISKLLDKLKTKLKGGETKNG